MSDPQYCQWLEERERELIHAFLECQPEQDEVLLDAIERIQDELSGRDLAASIVDEEPLF